MVPVICSLAILALMSGCVVEGPPPGPAVVSFVPDYYVWDGYEYVGVVGDQDYYLGPGNVWIVCDPVRVRRFNVWVGAHPDWHAHATVNVRYRMDAGGHSHPLHAPPAKHGDRDRDHDHGYH